MVEADGCKVSQHFSWSNFIKQLLLQVKVYTKPN
jgi:hypothetical protein